MSSFKQTIKDEKILCRLSVHKEKFRKKSFEGQYEEFGLIDTFDIRTNKYIGSMPLWWDENLLNRIVESGDDKMFIHRLTVSTLKPMIHQWTYEDYIKGYCLLDDINKIELDSGLPRVYNQITFLVCERMDNETYRWENREMDIEVAFNGVCR